jgi:OOP family OmpA-OmpF porin
MAQSAETRRKLSPMLWLIPLALLAGLAWWIGGRMVERHRIDRYIAELQEQPGIVVTAAERHDDGKWWVSGLRDPLAIDPKDLMAKAHLNPAQMVGRWEPYQALSTPMVLRRLQATLSPPSTVTLSPDPSGAIVATGSAPQHWVDMARAFIQTLPAGSPKIDLDALLDVQDPDYIRLRDAIQAQLIHFDFGLPRPSGDEEAKLDDIASDMRDLLKVARAQGFPVKVTIVGHADATGKDMSNLALSVGRAEVVRSMLRARGVDPTLLAVRGAGPLEPLKSGASEDELSVNRRVSFVVSTGD